MVLGGGGGGDDGGVGGVACECLVLNVSHDKASRPSLTHPTTAAAAADVHAPTRRLAPPPPPPPPPPDQTQRSLLSSRWSRQVRVTCRLSQQRGIRATHRMRSVVTSLHHSRLAMAVVISRVVLMCAWLRCAAPRLHGAARRTAPRPRGFHVEYFHKFDNLGK